MNKTIEELQIGSFDNIATVSNRVLCMRTSIVCPSFNVSVLSPRYRQNRVALNIVFELDKFHSIKCRTEEPFYSTAVLVFASGLRDRLTAGIVPQTS